jgi:hypothetical protein
MRMVAVAPLKEVNAVGVVVVNMPCGRPPGGYPVITATMDVPAGKAPRPARATMPYIILAV